MIILFISSGHQLHEIPPCCRSNPSVSLVVLAKCVGSWSPLVLKISKLHTDCQVHTCIHESNKTLEKQMVTIQIYRALPNSLPLIIKHESQGLRGPTAWINFLAYCLDQQVATATLVKGENWCRSLLKVRQENVGLHHKEQGQCVLVCSCLDLRSLSRDYSKLVQESWNLGKTQKITKKWRASWRGTYTWDYKPVWMKCQTSNVFFPFNGIQCGMEKARVDGCFSSIWLHGTEPAVSCGLCVPKSNT